jgi:hypothetical protein
MQLSKVAVVTGILVSIVGSAHADDLVPGWVVLTIGRVEVDSTDANGNPWDKPPPYRRGNSCDEDCEADGKVVGVLSPLLGKAAKLMCEGARDPDACKHQERPDLIVSVLAGKTVLMTPIMINSLTATFDTPMLVPLDGVPPDGLQIMVVDYDGPRKPPQPIGAVSVTRQMLEGALASGNAIAFQHAGKIISITMGVTQYTSSQPMKDLTFNVSGPPISTGMTAMAGEMALVQARGRYVVNVITKEPIDENGYSHGRHEYRLDDFPSSNQGGAIAYVGVEPIFVGSCAGVVVSNGGPVRVGINDNAPKNNTGTVTFKALVKWPTLEQWRNANTAIACAPVW